MTDPPVDTSSDDYKIVTSACPTCCGRGVVTRLVPEAGPGLREELAEALADFFHTDAGPLDLRAADALLPVVERHAARQTAEALREAAVSMDRKGHPYCPCSRRLRDRADTLDGKP
jgi:hypothetical protein